MTIDFNALCAAIACKIAENLADKLSLRAPILIAAGSNCKRIAVAKKMLESVSKDDIDFCSVSASGIFSYFNEFPDALFAIACKSLDGGRLSK